MSPTFNAKVMSKGGSAQVAYDHINISTNPALGTKTVRINCQDYTGVASIIGLQVKPRAGISQTNEIIGIESGPGIRSGFAAAGIVCYKAEPYIHSAGGAISGDVRGYEVSLSCPSGAGTISGVMSGIKCVNNTAKAVTGGIFPMYVVHAGDAQPWKGVMLLPDDSSIAWSTGTLSSAAGKLKVVLYNTTTGVQSAFYIPLYTS